MVQDLIKVQLNKKTDFSKDESYEVFKSILESKLPAELLGAFLISLRDKRETLEELQGALQAMSEKTIFSDTKADIELSYSYDGKKRNPYLLKKVCEILNKENVSVSVNIDNHNSFKDYIKDETFTPNLIVNDRESFLPQLHKLNQLRENIFLRTAFNTLEKLSFVSKPKVCFMGYHHKPYAQKYIDLFSPYCETFVLSKGDEGSWEMFKKGVLIISRNSTTEEIKVDPTPYLDDIDKLAEYNANILLYILDLKNSFAI